MKPLRSGAEQLTVEAAVGHLELLQVRESAPFRRNSTSKLVRSIDISRQIKNLKRTWKHLWQRACANKTPNSVATIKPLSMDAELTFNLVVGNIELFQIDELSELLGQASWTRRQTQNLSANYEAA